jgi:4-diphosphocytidyl-2-C-methyl-D-erythritol kinase
LAQTNDLEPAACNVAPVISDVLAALRREAPEALVRMSGSGATCFALVAGAEEAARLAAAMRAAHPVWWTCATVLG